VREEKIPMGPLVLAAKKREERQTGIGQAPAKQLNWRGGLKDEKKRSIGKAGKAQWLKKPYQHATKGEGEKEKKSGGVFCSAKGRYEKKHRKWWLRRGKNYKEEGPGRKVRGVYEKKRKV